MQNSEALSIRFQVCLIKVIPVLRNEHAAFLYFACMIFLNKSWECKIFVNATLPQMGVLEMRSSASMQLR